MRVVLSLSRAISLVIDVEVQEQQNIQLYQRQDYFLSFTLELSWMNLPINSTKTASKIHVKEFTSDSLTSTEFSDHTPVT